MLTIAYFITVAGGPIGVGPFRHPAMPFVTVLAATGLLTLTFVTGYPRVGAGNPARAALCVAAPKGVPNDMPRRAAPQPLRR